MDYDYFHVLCPYVPFGLTELVSLDSSESDPGLTAPIKGATDWNRESKDFESKNGNTMAGRRMIIRKDPR